MEVFGEISRDVNLPVFVGQPQLWQRCGTIKSWLELRLDTRTSSFLQFRVLLLQHSV